MKKSILIFLLAAGCSARLVDDREETYKELENSCKGGCFSRVEQLGGGHFVASLDINHYISRVSLRLSRVSNHPGKTYIMHLLNSSDPVIWSRDDILLSRGLLLELENEAELASLIAMEMMREMPLEICATHDDLKAYTPLPLEGALDALKLIVQAGYDPHALLSLCLKLQKIYPNASLSDEEMATLVKEIDDFGHGGYIGAHGFQNALEFLRKNAGAYSLYDKAKEALEKGDVEEAGGLARKALTLLPEEPHIHALNGEVAAKTGDYEMALSHLGRAIYLNPSYYAYHEERSKLLEKIGDSSEAAKELAISTELLGQASEQSL